MRGDQFGQIVEYVTRDGVFNVTPDVFALDSVPTLEAIKADYEKVAALGRAKTLDVQAVKAAASAVYAPEVIEAEITEDAAPTFDRLAWVLSRPEWRPNMDVDLEATPVVGRWIEGRWTLYQVVQAHSTEAGWEPESAKALFARWYNPDEPEAWVQPLGTHDSYRAGMKVLHNGSTWESLVPANVWEPGAVGTEALWRNLTPPPPTSAWAFPVAYKVGDRVTYQGSTYECRQAHTSQAGWAPPTVPALWQVVPT